MQGALLEVGLALEGGFIEWQRLLGLPPHQNGARNARDQRRIQGAANGLRISVLGQHRGGLLPEAVEGLCESLGRLALLVAESVPIGVAEQGRLYSAPVCHSANDARCLLEIRLLEPCGPCLEVCVDPSHRAGAQRLALARVEPSVGIDLYCGEGGTRSHKAVVVTIDGALLQTWVGLEGKLMKARRITVPLCVKALSGQLEPPAAVRRQKVALENPGVPRHHGVAVDVRQVESGGPKARVDA